MLTDDDVRRMSMEFVVDAVRNALLAHAAGRLSAPARIEANFGDGRLVFTAGRLAGEWFGYRSYDTMVDGTHVVVVHAADGALVGVVSGHELGVRRTGAIGAIAADLLAGPGALTVAVIGAGPQAWAQVSALRTMRTMRAVRVASPTAARRSRMVERVRDELGCPATGHVENRDAVDGADVVILATNSRSPVVAAAWLAEHAHVTTVGPKTVRGSELPVELVRSAGIVVTDSRAQLAAYRPAHIAAGADPVELGSALAGTVEIGGGSGRSLFLSTGLAGTEVAVAARLLDRHARSGPAH